MNTEESVDETGFDACAKIYLIEYKVYGVDPSGVKHLVIEEEGAYVIGIDAEDVIEQLKKDYINSEFNYTVENIMYHAVGTDIKVHNIELIGPLLGISLKSLKLIAESNPEIEGILPEELEDDE